MKSEDKKINIKFYYIQFGKFPRSMLLQSFDMRNKINIQYPYAEVHIDHSYM